MLGERPCGMYLTDPFGVGLCLGFSVGFLFAWFGLLFLMLLGL